MYALRKPVILAASVVYAAASGPSHAETAEQAEAIQALADVTLIDAECQTLNANFGIIFKYDRDHGVDVADLLPTGAKRAEIQAAFDRRRKSTTSEDLCGTFAAEYQDAFPGLFTKR